MNMMKRKYKVGIQILSTLIKSKATSIKEYIGCCYAYRGFGYAAIENHVKAVRDFSAASKLMELDKATLYNRYISEGILAVNRESYKKA